MEVVALVIALSDFQANGAHGRDVGTRNHLTLQPPARVGLANPYQLHLRHKTKITLRHKGNRIALLPVRKHVVLKGSSIHSCRYS